MSELTFYRNATPNTADTDCGHSVTECFFRTQSGEEAITHRATELDLRDRQLLRLLNNHDFISIKASEQLLEQNSITKLLDEGLIIQNSPCNTLCAKIKKTTCTATSDTIINTTNMDKQSLFDSKKTQQASRYSSTPNIHQLEIEPILHLLAGHP